MSDERRIGPPSVGEIRFATLVAEAMHNQDCEDFGDWMRNVTVRTCGEVGFSVPDLPVIVVEEHDENRKASILLVFDEDFFGRINDPKWMNHVVKDLQEKRKIFERLGLVLEPMNELTISRVQGAFGSLRERESS